MADTMTPQNKMALIQSNLQETMNPEILEDVIVKQNRSLIIYWGTATTGRPHCGYFVPMLKLAEFLKAGCTVKVLLADIHGFLDNLKAPIELVEHRAKYYRFCITNLLKTVGVPLDRLTFTLGSEYQLSAKYTMDLYRLSALTGLNDSKRAGAEVVKQVDNPLLSGLLYPLLQALDEEYLGVDAQFGGVDQRKIFALAKEALPKLGYKERAHMMNPMVPGLQGGKMSASDPDSKIDLLDPPEVVEKKLKKAFAVPKVVEENGLLSFVEYVLLPAGALKNDGKPTFQVDRSRDKLEPLVYSNIEDMHKDYREDTLNPQLLKPAIAKTLNGLLATIQEAYEASSEWQELAQKAYPPPPQEEKKKKVKKDKGNRYPGGAKNVEAQPDGSVEGSGKDQVDVGSGVTEAMEKVKMAEKAVDS